MTLVPGWRRVLRKARSVKWAIATGALGALEVAIPFLDGAIPHGYFAAASVLASFAIPIARIAVQRSMHDAQ